MSNKVCAMCGATGHTAPNCPWARTLTDPGLRVPVPTPVRTGKGQSRAASLAESVFNTLIGLIIAFSATALICWSHGIPMTWQNNLILTSWMTVISVARQYVIRRMWNAEFWKGWRSRWRYRNIDPELCCCGDTIGSGGSICHHGGCRSAKEHAISTETERL